MAIESMIIELIDVCNLNCSYCLRDEASLHGKAHALPIPELARILAELKKTVERCQVVFTGGEPTLHPEFRMALKTVQDIGWTDVVVTNDHVIYNACASGTLVRVDLETFRHIEYVDERPGFLRTKAKSRRSGAMSADCVPPHIPLTWRLTQLLMVGQTGPADCCCMRSL